MGPGTSNRGKSQWSIKQNKKTKHVNNKRAIQIYEV